MSFRNISAWAIRNPVPPIVLFVALLLAGILSFNRMSVNGQPDIEFPGAFITIAQPGAAPSELETQVTVPVEAAIRGVSGVEQINSTVREGSSGTFVQFAIGTPVDRAVSDLRDAVSNIRGDLPDGILEPQVTRLDASGDALVIFSAETTGMTLEELSWFVDNTLAKELRSVPGVAAVSRGGGVDREIRVILNPARVQALGLTASQINQQLRTLNLNAAGGRSEIGGTEQSVRVLGNAQDAYALSAMNITAANGQSVKLGDIATVRDSFAEQRNLAMMNGRQVLSFTVERSKGASDVSVYDGVQEVIDKAKQRYPSIGYTELYTSVGYTKDQYKSAIQAMIEGSVLAVIVVFIFLKDWRSTLISAIAIPLSAIPAFFFMDLLGFTLNSLSLLALSLVAGVLVDDAIVEIENIVRHMRMGKTAYQASIDAADEIGLAVLATTMAIVAVFLPVGLMPGISGQFFKNFGLTVVSAVLVSLAVARLITPMLAAYFLKAQGAASHGEGWLMDKYMAMLHWSLDSSRALAVRQRFTAYHSKPAYFLVPALVATAASIACIMGGFWYAALIATPLAFALALVLITIVCGVISFITDNRGSDFLNWCRFGLQRSYARLFDHRTWIGGIGLAALFATVLAFTGIPQVFVPPEDTDFSQVNISLPPGATLADTQDVATRVAAMIERQPEVKDAFASINVGSANIFITLKKDRSQSSIEFERGLTPRLAATPDARVSFQSQNGGGPGTSGRDISITLGGDDSELLNATAAKVVREMQTLPGVVAPRTNADARRPEIIIKPRTQLATELGVSTAALSQAIRIATLGEIDQNSAKFSLNDRQIPIRVQLGESSRRSLASIENMPVQTTRGGSVPLKLVADISFGSGPITIQRSDQKRRVTLGADLAPGFVTGDVMPKIDELPTMKNLPEGVTKIELGPSRWQKELLINFVIALVTGILLVFATLVLLYKRLLPPLVNMGSLALAPLGGALALRITGDALSLPVFIGILLLLGIVAKNSILLVDFALEEMDKGVETVRAIIDAGHKRAQPILMTTVAMVAGMIPVSLSLGGDGSFRAPMGVTVIGGLIVSTILTLVIVPAGFSVAIGVERRLGPWLRRALLTYKPGDEDRPLVPAPAE